jgi:hypothetical protein
MAATPNELERHGQRMYVRFASHVAEQKWVRQFRRDHERQARSVGHLQSIWNAAELDANIYFEIVCFGAFTLSMCSVGHVERTRLLLGKTFDRSAWGTVDTGISTALYSDIAELYGKFPGQSHYGAASTLQAAQIAFIGYKRHVTDDDAGANMLMLSRLLRSPEKGGSHLFSTRVSHSVDPELGDRLPAFQTQWIPFALQIVDWTNNIVEGEFRGAA